MKRLIIYSSIILAGNCLKAQQVCNLSVDWGVYWEDEKTKKWACDPFTWVCKISLLSDRDDIADDIKYVLTNEETALHLTFKNTILSSADYQRLFGDDFNSGGRYAFYTLPNDVCEKLGLELGFKIFPAKYLLDKTKTDFTTIIFNKN